MLTTTTTTTTTTRKIYLDDNQDLENPKKKSLQREGKKKLRKSLTNQTTRTTKFGEFNKKSWRCKSLEVLANPTKTKKLGGSKNKE
jgi:hypothetical protein